MWDKRPGDQFEMTDGSIVSFTEYYQQQYNRTVQDKDQPLLVIFFFATAGRWLTSLVSAESGEETRGRGPGRGFQSRCLPHPRVLRNDWSDGGDEERQTDYAGFGPAHTSTAGVEDRTCPRISQESYRVSFWICVSDFTSAGGHFSSEEIQKLFSTWSLSLGKDVAEVKARVLPPEELKAGSNTTFKYDPASGDWAKESRGTKLTKAVNLEHWVFVFPKGQRDKAEEFFTNIRDIGGRIGMTIEKPQMSVSRLLSLVALVMLLFQ